MKKYIACILLSAFALTYVVGCSKTESVKVTEVESIPGAEDSDILEKDNAIDETEVSEDGLSVEDEYIEYGYMAYDDLLFELETWMINRNSEYYVYDEDERSPEKMGLSSTFMYATDTMGYVIEDINGDGIKELLLGEDSWGDKNGTVLYDIFTVTKEGNMVLLANGGERDRFYICQGGIIYEEGSSGADATSEDYWIIEEGKLSKADAVSGTTFMNYDLSYFMDGDKLLDSDMQELSEGKTAQDVIYPQVYLGDYDNGTFYVSFDRDNLLETEENLIIKDAGIYTMDCYDIADIAQLEVGKRIAVDGILYEIESITDENGYKLINGGFSEGGVTLEAVDESNCYMVVGVNDLRTYTFEDNRDLIISDKVTYEDSSDLESDPVKADVDSLYEAVMTAENEYFNQFNTTVTIEDGEVISIIRIYVP